MIASIDFETYSSAGYKWNEEKKAFTSLSTVNKKSGLSLVGTANYVKYVDAEVLCCAYDVSDTVKLWHKSLPPPLDLFDYVKKGGLISAWNVAFEKWVWSEICVKRMQWPEIRDEQWRCTQALAKAYCLPPSLDLASKALRTTFQKDKEGERLIKKFCIPHKPDKIFSTQRILLEHDLEDAEKLFLYCKKDVETEKDIRKNIPNLSDFELQVWKLDQLINKRGVTIDVESINACLKIIEKTSEKYTKKLIVLTDGKITAIGQSKRFIEFLNENGVAVSSVSSAVVSELLNGELPAIVRKVLKIRKLLSLASVKKIYSILYRVTEVGRLHDLFSYHKARTGRASGVGPQPQNLPKPTLKIMFCDDCVSFFSKNDTCRHCNGTNIHEREWDEKCLEYALHDIKSENLKHIEKIWKDPLRLVSSCIRGLFVASPGHKLICSDFSAIEAVVLAELSGESWRQEVFRTHGKIYETSAAKIAGKTLQELLEYKEKNGKHHELRHLGKVAELASGYGGGVGSWRRFGADAFLSDDEITTSVKAWRKASPKIVSLWYTLEDNAKLAILNPGKIFTYRNISYFFERGILFCELPSKRKIAYHEAKIIDNRICFFGHNTNSLAGKVGWVELETYGGRLVENVVQAVARDILVNSMLNLELAGFPVVLHVHDEIVSEIPENSTLTLPDFEKIMALMPAWARGWPIKATGGWIGKRYRKQ